MREQPWHSVPFDLPQSIPTMISAEERRYLHWLGRDFWTDGGHIVEVGPWLGGSTFCLAAGMAGRGQRPLRHRLHVFDSFEWRPFMSARAALPLADGDSFQPYFEQNVAPFSELIVAAKRFLPDEALAHDPVAVGVRHVAPHDADVLRWGAGPIEILFIDGAKSWNGMLHLLAETAAALLPSRTLLVCQDYKHWGCYWVPAIIGLLGGSVRPVHVLGQNTVSFLVERELAQQLRGIPTLQTIGISECLALLDGAATHLLEHDDAAGAALVSLGKVRFLGHRGQYSEAVEEFRRMERGWSPRYPARALAETRSWLEEQTGGRLRRSPVLLARSVSHAVLRRGHRLYRRIGELMSRMAPTSRVDPR